MITESAISEATLQTWGRELFIEGLGPTDAMADVLAQVDCLELPSYPKGLPRSMLGPSAMWLPVLATDLPVEATLGAAREVIDTTHD